MGETDDLDHERTHQLGLSMLARLCVNCSNMSLPV